MEPRIEELGLSGANVESALAILGSLKALTAEKKSVEDRITALRAALQSVLDAAGVSAGFSWDDGSVSFHWSDHPRLDQGMLKAALVERLGASMETAAAVLKDCQKRGDPALVMTVRFHERGGKS